MIARDATDARCRGTCAARVQAVVRGSGRAGLEARRLAAAHGIVHDMLFRVKEQRHVVARAARLLRPLCGIGRSTENAASMLWIPRETRPRAEDVWVSTREVRRKSTLG
jgi:hypothetical protein